MFRSIAETSLPLSIFSSIFFIAFGIARLVSQCYPAAVIKAICGLLAFPQYSDFLIPVVTQDSDVQIFSDQISLNVLLGTPEEAVQKQ